MLLVCTNKLINKYYMNIFLLSMRLIKFIYSIIVYKYSYICHSIYLYNIYVYAKRYGITQGERRIYTFNVIFSGNKLRIRSHNIWLR